MFPTNDGESAREIFEKVLTRLLQMPPSLVREVLVCRYSVQSLGSPGIDGCILYQLLATLMDRCTADDSYPGEVRASPCFARLFATFALNPKAFQTGKHLCRT